LKLNEADQPREISRQGHTAEIGEFFKDLI